MSGNDIFLEQRARHFRKIAAWMTREFSPQDRDLAAQDHCPAGSLGIDAAFALLEPEPPTKPDSGIAYKGCLITFHEYCG